MIAKDNLTIFPFTTPKRVFLYPRALDLKVNFSYLNSLVVAMSIRNDPAAEDLFVFVVEGGKYLKLLTFNAEGPMTHTLMGKSVSDVLKHFERSVS